MPRSTKKRRRSRSARNIQKQQERKANALMEDLALFEELAVDIRNPRGRTRGFEENKLLLLALLATLKRHIANTDGAKKSIANEVCWTHVERDVAEDFHVGREYLYDLRKVFLEDVDAEDERTGAILVWDCDKRGGIGDSQKVDAEVLKDIATFVDDAHKDGESATNHKIRSYLEDKHGLTVSRRTVQRCLKRLGLAWKRGKPKKKTLTAYRKQAVKDYLVGLDRYVRHINSGNQNGYVFVYTDESYVHPSHCLKNSYFANGEEHMNRGTGKGRRLIILHAITADGPLVERDDAGVPIDDLHWNGDTPHPGERDTGEKKTCETLWLAQSHTGDYHDNMNSDMFMQWIETRLLPVFESTYPEKRMILVADNAPYHHKRKIGSLASLSKKQIIDLMVQHEVEWLELPLNDLRLEYLETLNETAREEIDRGDCIQIAFDPSLQRERAGRNPLIGNADELKVSFVNYVRDEKPDLLECKVESVLRERGHEILWTPPYCPDLQPIELFWAAGKNYVARWYTKGRSLKQTVQHLRDGWYGTFNRFGPKDPHRNVAVDCSKLVAKSIDMANTKFIPRCEGLSGTIGNLQDAEIAPDEPVVFPIDALVLDLTKEHAEDGDNVLNAIVNE